MELNRTTELRDCLVIIDAVLLSVALGNKLSLEPFHLLMLIILHFENSLACNDLVVGWRPD